MTVSNGNSAINNQTVAAFHTESQIQVGRSAAQAHACEESPDRKGHFTAEIADRGNLMVNVTENNRILRYARVKM